MTPEEYALARWPEIDQSRFSTLLPIAEDTIGSNWGDCREKAISLLIMHWITLEHLPGNSSGVILPGRVMGLREGDLSISYAEPQGFETNGGTASLTNTQYGKEFIRLRRGCFLLPRNRYV